jgi:hypothetical protein
MAAMAHLSGDPDGIEVLKAMAATHRDYFKFLIAEAQSNTHHVAEFRDDSGTKWELRIKVDSGDLEVRRAPAPDAAPDGH